MYITGKLIKENSRLDSIYSSFWAGKLINSFIRKGKKKLATRSFNKVLINLKYNNNLCIPIITIYELLEQVKPMFKLDNCFPGMFPTVYPRLVKLDKHYIVALHWVKDIIMDDILAQPKRGRGESFMSVLLHNIITLHGNKAHRIYKMRDMYHQKAVKFQDNIRFSWPKSR